jgi:hypothetical protein
MIRAVLLALGLTFATGAVAGELERWRCTDDGVRFIFEADMREGLGATRVQVGGKWYPDVATDMMHTVMGDRRAIAILPKRGKVEFIINSFYDTQSGRCAPANEAARKIAACYKNPDGNDCQRILFE